jgi:hypothetical protein
VIRISDKYDFAASFSEGLARVAVKMGVSEGYIDRDGKMVIPARYSTVGDFSDGLAVACADECVYIDHSGSEVPPLKKIGAYWPFSDGLAAVGFYGPTVYVNKKGKTIAPYAMK